MAERETGTVKWFSRDKGYGFIERPNGTDIFVHHSGIRGEGGQALREGDRVEFEMAQGPKGPHAQDVVVIREEAPAEINGADDERIRPGERETGSVKWFHKAKGYGFIARPDGGEIFVHHSGIRGEGAKTLNEGDQVEFQVVQGQKGLQAQDAVVIEPEQEQETPGNASSGPIDGGEGQPIDQNRPDIE